MLFAILTGCVSLLTGHEFLESAIFSAEFMFIGKVKASSVLFFDIGVYLVVLGMSLLLLEQLGDADGTNPDEVQP